MYKYLYYLVAIITILSGCSNIYANDQETSFPPHGKIDSSLAESPVETSFSAKTWQDIYTKFLQGVKTYGYQERDEIIPGSFDIPPLFYLYNIDNDEIPELIVISDNGNWEKPSCDIYTYRENSCQWIGSVKFNWFGTIGAPANIAEGLYSDDTYKGHYGSLYYYTIKNNTLIEQLVRDYSYQHEPDKNNYSYIYLYDKNGESKKISEENIHYNDIFKTLEYVEFEFYQVTKDNIEKVITKYNS